MPEPSKMPAPPARLVLMGHIAGAQGLRGEVKIQSYTARPEDIAAYGPLFGEGGARQYEIIALRPAKGAALIARLKGVDDRTAAEALKGEKLFVPRSRLPPPTGDEYYVSDLIGLKARNPAGEMIGEIIAVQNYGAGDLLEIRLEDARKTELIPFTAAFAPHVSIADGSVTVIRPTFDEEPGE